VPYGAVVIGATGAVGSALVGELLASPECTRITALVRRSVDTWRGSPGVAKLRLEVIDFTSLEAETARLAPGHEAAFCTMGVGQPRKVTAEEHWRVDVEYAGQFARGARGAGVRHISLLSSVGANASSRSRYLRVKGTAEAAVIGAGIPRTSLFRPSLLVTPNARYGLQDRVTQALFPIVSPLLPSRFSEIRVQDLARAMRMNAEGPGGPGVEVLHYSECMRFLVS
jgi:uncharacterized protein YbjT (DUF2867 family)